MRPQELGCLAVILGSLPRSLPYLWEQGRVEMWPRQLGCLAVIVRNLPRQLRHPWEQGGLWKEDISMGS